MFVQSLCFSWCSILSSHGAVLVLDFVKSFRSLSFSSALSGGGLRNLFFLFNPFLRLGLGALFLLLGPGDGDTFPFAALLGRGLGLGHISLSLSLALSIFNPISLSLSVSLCLLPSLRICWCSFSLTQYKEILFCTATGRGEAPNSIYQIWDDPIVLTKYYNEFYHMEGYIYVISIAWKESSCHMD